MYLFLYQYLRQLCNGGSHLINFLSTWHEYNINKTNNACYDWYCCGS